MKRSHPQDQGLPASQFGGRDDERHPDAHAPQMGEPSRSDSQFGSSGDHALQDGHGGLRDDEEAHPHQMGAGDDRVGGHSGTDEPRGGQSEGVQSNLWDEDRFASLEAHRHARDLNPRGSCTGYGSQGRFGNDWPHHPARYGGSPYGGSTQFGQGPFGSRPYAQDFRASFNSASSEGDAYRSNRFGQQDWNGESFAGDGDTYAAGQDAYGIPAGSEPGGYGFNSPWRRGAQNWSGSNWADDQDWHSRSRTGAFGAGFVAGPQGKGAAGSSDCGMRSYDAT